MAGQIETQEEADALNNAEYYGPFYAANGHLMRYNLVQPRSLGAEREYRIGDYIKYEQWSAWCDPSCDHSESGPSEDW